MTRSDELIWDAEDALERGDLDAAVALLERAVEMGSRNAIFNLANVEYRRRNDERAVELYLRALAEGENDALLNLATVLLALKRWAEAKERFQQALDLLGDNRALLGLADATEALGDRTGAVDLLRRAVQGGVEGALSALASSLARDGQLPEALALWEQAAAEDPKALVDRGLFYEGRGESALAQADFIAAVERGEGVAHFYLARNYRRQGLYELAERHYRLAAEAGEGDAGYHELAGMLAETGRLDDAENAYRRATAAGSPCAEEHRRDLRLRGRADE